ncbi:MAG: hypothetical protein WBD56_02070 [Anaerolineales bacterium]
MTGSTLMALAANPASSLETSTLSSTVSTAAASVTAASTTAASATAASAARNAWTSNFSSIVQSFVPLRFAIFFYSKIFIIEPTHGAPPAPNQRTMGYA